MRRLLLLGFACLLAPPCFLAPTAHAADATRETLPNGLRVVIVQDKLAPVVTTEINYLAGSNDAPAGFPGTAHALEHMMFRGSNGLDKDQLSELASSIGGNYNADTTETVTQYFYTVPSEDLGLALKVEALRMGGALLHQQDWDKERGAIEQEVSRDLSSPVYKYLAQLQSILFAGTPYEHDALGTRPSFDKTDATLLRHFYESWYAPNNAILVIAGDVDPQAVLAQVRAAFGAIPSRPIPAHKPVTPAPVTAQTLTLTTDFPIGLATIAYRMPGRRSPDFAAADILSDVLASQRAGLYGLVVDGTSLTSEFAFEAKAEAGYGVAVGGFPNGTKPDALLTAMRAVLSDAATKGVPAELVEAAKRRELAQIAFRATDISGVAESWSEALAFSGLNSPDDIANRYKAVTTDQVNALARRLLNPAEAITAILEPRQSGKPGTGRGFGGAESFGGTPDHPVTLPDWAASKLATLQIPTPAPAPTDERLPNGLRLIVRETHVSPTISVFGEIRSDSDLQAPKGQEGVDDLTGQLLDYGTTQHDRVAFLKALDDIAADEDSGTGFSLQVLTSQFPAGMKLLAENELQPAFPARAFSIVQTQSAQSLAGLLQSPDYLFGRATRTAIVPPKDPTLREATPATVGTLTRNDLVAYHQAVYRPDLTTIVIIGDVTPQQARTVVEQAFGTWHATGPTPNVDLPRIPPSKPSIGQVPDSASVQDSVTLTESIPADVKDPDHYPLLLGNTILGGGFASRLYDDLRVRGGYVYSIDSSLDWSRTRATYDVSFGADPDKVPTAVALVARNLERMQKEPVTGPELTRAKAQTLRRLPMQQASVSALAHLYLRLVDLGLPLDTPQRAAQAYYSMTADQIRAAFAKWIRPNDLSRVIKGPAPPS